MTLQRRFKRDQPVRYIGPQAAWHGLCGVVDHSTGPTRFRVFLSDGTRNFGITTDETNLEERDQ